MKREIKDIFAGKTILILGLGLLGRGVGVARFLARAGAHLIVTDLKSEKKLAASLKGLKRYSNITYVLGKHRVKDVDAADMIIRSTAVRYNSPFVLRAKEKHIPVEMDASLFAKLMPEGVQIVGITGTRGKSTVSYATAHILEQSKSGTGNVYLAGNVRGVATLPLLEKVKKGDVVVLELDSWQLQGFGEARISPSIAVFTTFMRDHMDYYRGNMRVYMRDKTHVYRHQKKGDVFIASKDALSAMKAYGAPKPKGTVVTPTALSRDMKTKLIGEHNRHNLALAVEACRALGIAERDIAKGVATFSGVEGRLEYMGSIKGVEWYNDNNASSPDATIAALTAFKKKKKPVVLIAGGTDKNLDLRELALRIARVPKAVILFPGTATDALLDMVREMKQTLPIMYVESMKEAVSAAHDIAEKGDTVLLSPGASSKGLFKNEYDRNDQFIKEVKKLRKK
ncbi:MAG: UDP-N-acetylmuramoyl-L-alanine--D-glutamate ligase [Parcubacteria group bacterium]|nr:UDP-N-acetylmuramoyl-L-alanine--D-glutamate ligase [Parcubacteria group bacterium]